MIDGLVTENIRAASVVADVGSLATGITAGTAAFAASEIGSTEIAAAAVTASKQSFVGIGSPSTTGSPAVFAATVYAGSNATSAGGSVWQTFHANYTAHPYVLITGQRSAAGITVGSITPGSFWASGTASTTFDWMSVGV